jgi:hypothetical protein
MRTLCQYFENLLHSGSVNRAPVQRRERSRPHEAALGHVLRTHIMGIIAAPTEARYRLSYGQAAVRRLEKVSTGLAGSADPHRRLSARRTPGRRLRHPGRLYTVPPTSSFFTSTAENAEHLHALRFASHHAFSPLHSLRSVRSSSRASLTSTARALSHARLMS